MKVKDIKTGKAYGIEYRIGREKVKDFIGICIANRKKGKNHNIVLRNSIYGVGVEYTFYLYSKSLVSFYHYPVSKGKFTSSKLYYLRERPLRYSKV